MILETLQQARKKYTTLVLGYPNVSFRFMTPQYEGAGFRTAKVEKLKL